jgi:hypothetical protein
MQVQSLHISFASFILSPASAPRGKRITGGYPTHILMPQLRPGIFALIASHALAFPAQ